MKPTPGPWYRDLANNSMLIKSDTNHVCKVLGSSSNESCIADANLIAAAPEIYDALKAMIAWYGDDAADWSSIGINDQARAAIAKAEGVTE